MTGPSALFIAGARPRTLPAAVVPVGVGTAVAAGAGAVVWWRAVFALVVALALQVGVNYANDYSDGVRGTDSARVGPPRLVASGVTPLLVRRAAFVSFAVAAVAGLVLAIATSPVLIAVGAVCVAAAWLYTGGPRPYGYAGLGELFVFVFFGLVAVAGTAYVSHGSVTSTGIEAGVPVGLLSVALLVVNNLRDMASDEAAGKRTLAVRLGDRRTREAYLFCTVLSFAWTVGMGVVHPPAFLGLLAVVAAVPPVRAVLEGETGAGLVRVLGMTSRLLLVFGLLFSIGLAL